MKARIRQLVERHRSKVAAVGDTAVVFGTIVLATLIPGLAPLAVMGLAVWGYCKGQANGYTAGRKAGESAGRRAEAQRVIDQVDAALAEREERIAR